MIRHVVTGIWEPGGGVFSPDSEIQFRDALHNITKCLVAMRDVSTQFSGDFKVLAEHLGITDRLLNITEFNKILNSLLTARNNVSLSKQQYEDYCWLMEVFKHTLPHGSLIWEHRTVLLDLSDPADWMTHRIVR